MIAAAIWSAPSIGLRVACEAPERMPPLPPCQFVAFVDKRVELFEFGEQRRAVFTHDGLFLDQPQAKAGAIFASS